MQISSKSRILITGGTGSFGKAFLKKILNEFPDIERLVIFSRDELKQWEMSQNFPIEKYPNLRFFLGDIRDKERLLLALEGIDIVVHAAALKQVPTAEYNPMEFIQTNVIGSENLIQACLKNRVKKVVALSTDKAAAPVNLYGATKLCADKLFVAANNIRGSKDIKFSVVRYGNVMGSRGSVVPFFLNEAKKGVIPITDKNMTRFNITLTQGVEMVIWAINNTLSKEIFVPKIPSMRITDLAEAISPSSVKKIVGIRPGEKIHEEMITSVDSLNTIDLGKYYAILPNEKEFLKDYEISNYKFKKLPQNFSYNSFNNKDYLDVESIRALIKENVDDQFIPI